jgi:hypothetical protein
MWYLYQIIISSWLGFATFSESAGAARCEGHEAARRGDLQAFEGPFHEQRLGLRAQNARNHWEISLFCMDLLLSKWMSHTCLQINDHNQ